jgi:hypothetical protein
MKFMKHTFLKVTMLMMVFIVIISSCSKKIDEAYMNPNAAVRQPIENIFPGVIGGMSWFASAAGTGYGVITDGTFVGRYIQYYGINSSGDTWGQMSMLGGAVDNGGSVWAMVYYGHGQNINRIIQWGSEEEKWDYVGAALAIRAWDFLELTQEYDIGILREAWLDQSSFHYQDQPEILDSVRAIALRAVDYLNRTDGKVSQQNLAIGDAYFNNGDREKWKKFAYGTIARSYNLLSTKNAYVSSGWADSAIKYANLAQQTNADNAMVRLAGTATSGGPSNYWYNFWGPTRGNFGAYRQGEYVARLMNGDDTTLFAGNTDPRAWYILSENLNGTFKGLRPWAGNATLTNDYPKNYWRHPTPTSTVPPAVDSSRYLYGNTSPWPIMTAAEMQFILAEAHFKKGNKDAALLAYKNGISLSFDFLLSPEFPQKVVAGKEITPAVKAAYMANIKYVPPTSAELTISHIMNQKYIALYIWGTLETWADMRKYHYIDIDPQTTKKVYAGFTPPSGTNLVATNLGQLTYRMRPRFNSEYLYNIPELTRVGAYQYPEYNTFKTWFALP